MMTLSLCNHQRVDVDCDDGFDPIHQTTFDLLFLMCVAASEPNTTCSNRMHVIDDLAQGVGQPATLVPYTNIHKILHASYFTICKSLNKVATIVKKKEPVL